VQARADGAPTRLLYSGIPAGHDRSADPRWAVVDPRFLTVRVPYDDVDLAATRQAFACHQSQFAPDQVEPLLGRLNARLRGHVYLRPWFGAGVANDVFDVEIR
jgi:hypothetical protein